MGIIIGYQSNQGIATVNPGQAANVQSTSAFTEQKDIDMLNGLQYLAMGAQNLNNAILQQKDDTNDSQQNNEQEITTPQQQENTLAEEQQANALIEQQVNPRTEEEQKKRRDKVEVIDSINAFNATASEALEQNMQENTGKNAKNTVPFLLNLFGEAVKSFHEKYKDAPELFASAKSNLNSMLREMLETAKEHGAQGYKEYEAQVLEQKKTTTKKRMLNASNSTVAEKILGEHAYTAIQMYKGNNKQEKKLSKKDQKQIRKEIREKVGKEVYEIEKSTYYTQLETQAQENPEFVLNLLKLPPAFAILEPEAIAGAEKAGKEFGINPSFIKSMIYVESKGKFNATSQKGAVGYMQLMKGTREEYEDKYRKEGEIVDGLTKEGNIRIGTRYIDYLMGRYNENREHGLSAYNWGLGEIDEFVKTGKGKHGKEMSTETKEYPGKVFERYKLNMLQNDFSEKKEYLREVAENTYAEKWVNRMVEQFKTKKISEAEALKSVNTIPYKSVRGIAQKKLEEEFHIMRLQKQEEEESAQHGALNELKAILHTDIPDSEKLRNFYALSREAKKRAKGGNKADKLFYNSLQEHLQKHTTFSSYFPSTLKRK